MRSLATNSKGTSFRTGVMRIGGGIPYDFSSTGSTHRPPPYSLSGAAGYASAAPPAESLWMPILEHALHCYPLVKDAAMKCHTEDIGASVPYYRDSS